MAVLMVNYDLDSKGEQAYAKIISVLEKLNARHLHKSGWLVATTLSPIKLKERLTKYLDKEDGDTLSIFRVDMKGGCATMGLAKTDREWIRDQFKRDGRIWSRLPIRLRGKLRRR